VRCCPAPHFTRTKSPLTRAAPPRSDKCKAAVDCCEACKSGPPFKDCVVDCIKTHLDGKTIEAGICVKASGCVPQRGAMGVEYHVA